MYALVVVAGPRVGARFALPDREPQLIGRSTEAIPIADESVSRRHAELTPDDGRWWIRDLDSTNGTFVNDQPVLDRTPLQPGDRIRCGDTEFQLRHVDEGAIHGRLRAPDPDGDRVRLRPPTAPSLDAAALHALFGRPGDAPATRLPALARLLEADAVAIVPVDAAGLCLDGLEVRTPDGDPPEAPFDLPRELVAAAVSTSDPCVAEIDGRGEVAAVIPTVRGHRRLVAAIRTRPWTEVDLRTLTMAATVLGLELEASDRTADSVRFERLAAMGEATAALSHSVKNILQGMRGGADAVELALSRERLDLAREGWTILARNLDRIMSLSLNMLAYSKERELDLVATRAGAIAAEAISMMAAAADRAGVTLACIDDAHEPPIPLDPDAIHQVILNLVGNAIDATDRGGRIEVRVQHDPDAATTVVLVADDGPGVPLDRRERVFEPFYSTRGQRGTGLGLAVARKLVERHGGRLTLDPPGPGGAVFRVVLPATRDDDPEAEDTRGPSPIPNAIQGDDLGVRFES